MPGDAKPRWITVRKPFDYHWPGRAAITAFSKNDLGEHHVKAEVADFAVENGYATEGKVDRSARSKKGRSAKPSPRAAQETKAAETADASPAEVVDNADAADADRPADGAAVDNDAG
jgi:hypothetical protein